MASPYFSEREQGPRPRDQAEIHQTVWMGIRAAIERRIRDGSFGYRHPKICQDGAGPCGCDQELFLSALGAEVPGIDWDRSEHRVPDTLAILDQLEFCHERVAAPISTGFHSFFQHHHLRFDPDQGQCELREEINRILARNGLIYEFNEEGRVVRAGPVVAAEAIRQAIFRTGDAELDRLLEAARRKFFDPDPTVRREALETLWDAWERLKTIEPGRDKQESVGALLARTTSQPKVLEALDAEARALTEIGNTFRIRHSETTQVPLDRDELVDYLFHRMFAIIRLLLKATGRGG